MQWKGGRANTGCRSSAPQESRGSQAVGGEYEASGLSRVDFCQKQGLSLPRWPAIGSGRRKRPGGREPLGGGEGVRRPPVQEGGASSGLAVALPSGRRIEIGREF